MGHSRNPIVWGVIAVALVYAYLWHKKSTKIKTYEAALQAALEQGAINQQQMGEQLTLASDEQISLMYPVAAGVVVWIGACMYFKKPKARGFHRNSERATASSDLLSIISCETSDQRTKHTLSEDSEHRDGGSKVGTRMYWS